MGFYLFILLLHGLILRFFLYMHVFDIYIYFLFQIGMFFIFILLLLFSILRSLTCISFLFFYFFAWNSMTQKGKILQCTRMKIQIYKTRYRVRRIFGRRITRFFLKEIFTAAYEVGRFSPRAACTIGNLLQYSSRIFLGTQLNFFGKATHSWILPILCKEARTHSGSWGDSGILDSFGSPILEIF